MCGFRYYIVFIKVAFGTYMDYIVICIKNLILYKYTLKKQFKTTIKVKISIIYMEVK